MAASHDRTSRIDGRAARLVALGVFVACIAVLAYMHRADLWSAPPDDDSALNPEFVACRDARTATVDTMLAEGFIDEAKHAQFTERAVAICADEFPMTGTAGQ